MRTDDGMLKLIPWYTRCVNQYYEPCCVETGPLIDAGSAAGAGLSSNTVSLGNSPINNLARSCILYFTIYLLSVNFKLPSSESEPKT